jgi:hypothetical protein
MNLKTNDPKRTSVHVGPQKITLNSFHHDDSGSDVVNLCHRHSKVQSLNGEKRCCIVLQLDHDVFQHTRDLVSNGISLPSRNTNSGPTNHLFHCHWHQHCD